MHSSFVEVGKILPPYLEVSDRFSQDHTAMGDSVAELIKGITCLLPYSSPYKYLDGSGHSQVLSLDDLRDIELAESSVKSNDCAKSSGQAHWHVHGSSRGSDPRTGQCSLLSCLK